MTGAITVVLISTCAPDRPGSMARYAQLVHQSLQGREHLQVQTAHLAPTAQQLSKWPGALRSTLHHRAIRRKAADLRERVVYHLLDGSHGYVLDHLPAGAKKVATCHDFIPLLHLHGSLPGRPNPLSRSVIQHSVEALGRADAVVCVSAATQTVFTQRNPDFLGGKKVIHSPVSDGWQTSAPERPVGDKPYLFHIGHNAAYKNRMGVLRIFERIATHWPGKLLMAGDTPTREMLQFLHSRNLATRVAFKVHPGDEELWALYRGASLFLFPSLVEGYGWPPLEAAASGCPVVAWAVGALPDALGKEGAVLLAPGDEAGFAASCLQLLNDPAMAAGLVRHARGKLAALTVERFGQQLEDIYLELAS
jgi:glycosyltransferase involved in cell wall biosynthesis